ncbi:MAG: SUMF1/EgtB/PvdO family nonheme iron enzyme [Gammaproteobacteria bacterium]|nr:SUMF1/EgtB/PvdO family nonheme iron enzyme [Gammaproteobacteria bacterium]
MNHEHSNDEPDGNPESAPAVTVTGNLQAGDGGVVVGQARNGVRITVHNWSVSDQTIRRYAAVLSLPADQAERVTRDFLQDIEAYYRYLPLKGMGDNSGLRLKFPLVELFVPLNARLTLPRGDTLPEKLRVAGRTLGEEEREHIGGRLDDLRPVLELLMTHPVLVVLGDPGSGKSTVVRFMAYLLATGQGDSFGWADYLPLLLPLSAYSEALHRQPDLSLRRFAVAYFSSRMDVVHLDALLDGHLEQGRALILLDGLDEVKEVSQRNLVVDRVQAFLSRYVRKGNRAIITSRIIGYREVRPPEIEGLRECTLLDFEKDEIESFIRRWTRVIELQAYPDNRVARYEAERETQELLEAVRQNSAVARLAANPLLLTMLVIQKRQGSQLPRHRVVLYERYLTSLLHDWLIARNIHAAAHVPPNERALRRLLEPLAWWLQESEPGKGLVAEADLLRWLREQPVNAGSDGEERAYRFIADVRENSGLLIDRGGRKFGFLHPTFMEYLAAVWLANQIQREDGLEFVAETVRRYAAVSEWREVLLLAIGHIGLNQKLDLLTTKLLRRLMATDDGSGAVKAIAAEALADIGEDGVEPESWYSLRQALLEQGLYNPRVKAVFRASIGRSLAVIGDPRAAVMTVEAMPFCRVSKGRFWMGLGRYDEKDEEVGSETPAGEYDLTYDYQLAQYPVTVAQFRQFVEDARFELEDKDALKGAPNSPVVWVSRDEAMVFCRWLTRRWYKSGRLPDDLCVTLPDEAEWERAARGGLADNPEPQRRYPWGNEITDEHLNYSMYIGEVATPGIYPLGKSPCGCDDLSGNVWEWTRSDYGEYPYPAVGTNEWKKRTNGLGAVGVLRGGAFYFSRGFVRCAVRFNLGQDYRFDIIGFRCCVVPITLVSERLWTMNL